MCDCICGRAQIGMYRSRQALAVDGLLTLLLGSVPIGWLIEHDGLELVDFGEPFGMLSNKCLIFEKEGTQMSALASRLRRGLVL